jgi:hypothetical protein
VHITRFLPSCAAREPAGCWRRRGRQPGPNILQQAHAGKRRRTGSMRYHPPRKMTTTPGRGRPEGAAGQSDKKKSLRQNPASRRFTAGSHMQARRPNLAQFGRTRGAPECTGEKGDDTLRPCCVIRSCRSQNKAGAGRRKAARRKTPPREAPPKGKPCHRKVALFRAAGWSTAREHHQGHPTVELTLQRVSRAGTSNCQEPALPPCAHTRTACVHGGVLTRRRS